MPSRSELMYFAMGLSIGGAVGANWSKIQPLLAAFMGPAAAGFKDAYGDLAEKFAAQAMATKKEPAGDEPEADEATKPRSKKRRKKKAAPMPPWFEELANSMSSN